MKLYERIENNNFDEIDRNRAIELIEQGNEHLVYNENCYKLQMEKNELKSQTDNCEPAVLFNGNSVLFNGNFLKKLAQAAKNVEPDKEYTLTEIESLIRDSENER